MSCSSLTDCATTKLHEFLYNNPSSASEFLGRYMQRSAGPPKSSLSSLDGIQYLRAIAALMVAYFHMIGQVPEYSKVITQYFFGWANLATGVDIFFVISGFIMLVTSRSSTPQIFFLRRIIRIVPLYWLLTTVLAVIVILAPNLFRTTLFTSEYYLKSLLFVPYHNAGHQGDVVPMLVPGWSLNFEMFFYVLFTFILFAPLKLRIPISAVVFGIMIGVGDLLKGAGNNNALLFFADIRLFEFWFGMLIGYFYLNKQLHLSRTLAWAFVIIGFAILLGSGDATSVPGNWTNILFLTMLPSAFIVLGAAAIEVNGGIFSLPKLKLLGDASYSIYLSHIFSLGFARFLWSRFNFQGNSIVNALVFVIFAMAIVVVAALLVYRYIEKPLHERGQRLIARYVQLPARQVSA